MTGAATRRLPVVVVVTMLVAVLVGLAVWWRTTEGTANAASPGERSVEAGFSRDMAVHHQQAVEMSFIVRDRTDDEDARRLAYDIINTQANQRGMLLGRLETWRLNKSSADAPMAWMGHGSMHEAKDGSLMPGMATNTQLDQLREAEDEDAEVLYLRLMTAHHQGGVDMAWGAVKMADDGHLVRLARTMVDGQQAEMDLMADMLAQRGATAGA